MLRDNGDENVSWLRSGRVPLHAGMKAEKAWLKCLTFGEHWSRPVTEELITSEKQLKVDQGTRS